MVSRLERAQGLLVKALKLYRSSSSISEYKEAILAMHSGLDKAFRAYLSGLSNLPAETQDSLSERGDISFPHLVDLMRDYTAVLGNSVRLLVSLNSTRNKIAHPDDETPLTSEEIVNDAQRLAELIHDLWPRLFGKRCPVSPLSPAAARVAAQPAAKPAPVQTTHPKHSYPKLARVLRRWWEGDKPAVKWRLVLLTLFCFPLADWAFGTAVGLARWEKPIKNLAVALAILSMALLIVGLWTLGRVLRQLGLRRLLITLMIVYLLLIVASVLISNSPRPIHLESISAARRIAQQAGKTLAGAVRSLASAPAEFRFAYTGRRPPLILPGRESASQATPLHTNIPSETPKHSTTAPPTPTLTARQPVTTLAPAGTQPPSLQPLATSTPSCPHATACLTYPTMGATLKGKAEIKGTANIENFAYYKFEFKREDIEDEWHWIESFETPVEEGVLGTWDVSHLPEGSYTFRLIVVNTQGNYPFPPCEVRVHVKH